VKIGELSDRVGIDPPTIRFYESVGVLPEPERTPSGYRDYRDSDVDRLRFVKRARSLDLTLDDIREMLGLRDRGDTPCSYVRSLLDRQTDEIERRIRELQELRVELTRLQDVARTLPDTAPDEPCVCHILQPEGAGVSARARTT
jgi:DNA-binding transcriptional MerR regulator